MGPAEELSDLGLVLVDIHREAEHLGDPRQTIALYAGQPARRRLLAPIERPLVNEPELAARIVGRDLIGRSDVHTSELQSLMRLSYAVFFLKTNNQTQLRVHITGATLLRHKTI